MKGFLKSSKGSVIILVAAGMVAFMGFAALAIDVGMLVVEKSRMQNAVDAAALAGAQELPDDTSNAKSIATDYVSANATSYAIKDIYFSQDDRRITVVATKEVPFIFAKLLGITQGEVEVQASAIKAPAGGISGLRPFGVFESDVNIGNDIDLMVGSWDNDTGNFGAVGLAHVSGGNTTGADIFEKNIASGSGETYYIGDLIYTEPGNMTGPEIAGLFADIFGPEGVFVHYSEGKEEEYPNRVITVPVLENTVINGTTQVKIIGFASIFVEGYSQEQTIDELLNSLEFGKLKKIADILNISYSNSEDDAVSLRIKIKMKPEQEIRDAYDEVVNNDSNNGQGHLVLKGHFLEMIEGYEPDPSNPSYGIEAVKLVE